MKEQDVIVSDEVMEMTEKEIEAMLESIMQDVSEPSERRVDSIMKRVKLETLVRESTEVMAEGITSGLKGIAHTMNGLVKRPDSEKSE